MLTAQQEADYLAYCEKRDAARKAALLRPLTLKVGEKGGVSVYGFGRFPVTLYKAQWIKLMEKIGEVKAFIEAHDAELSQE